MFIPLFFVVLSAAAEGFMITESLRESNSKNFVFGGNPVSFLTSGVMENNKYIDPIGDGWLRLTKDSKYQRGYAVVKQDFSSKLGVQIDLEYKIWRTDPKNQGADGLSIFLFDASTDSFRIGGFGGSLGYAPFDNQGAEPSDGLSDGYVGIGLDEFGNYSNPTEGRILGPGFNANSISVRGSSPEYKWLTGNFKLDFMMAYDSANITERPDDSTYYRRIQVDIIPNSGPLKDKFAISARMKTGKGNKFVTVLSSFVLPSAPPARLQLGFAASTGDCINYHELRNLYITTPEGIRVTKTVDKLNAFVGDELTYVVDVYNQSENFATNLQMKDLFDEQSLNKFKMTSVVFDNNQYTENVASGYSITDMSNVRLSMKGHSQSSFIIKGIIKGSPANKLLKSTVTTNVGTSGILDLDLTNDTARVSTTIVDLGLKAIDDYATTGYEKPVAIPVLDNDLENMDPIDRTSIEIMSQPKDGMAVKDSDGNIVYTPDDGFSGNDTLTYRMSDTKNLLSNIANVVVTVDPKELFIPNVFTPNGDGINDVFEIVGLRNYNNPILRICNRWGDEVYYTNNYGNDWDGNELNEGTYYYNLILEYKGNKVSHKGWVMLKR